MPDTMPDDQVPERPAPGHAATEAPEMLTVIADGDGVLVVSGDVDLAGGPILEQHIEEAAAGVDGRSVTVDLRNVSFIDSSGLRSLLAASRTAAGRGARLNLRHPSAGVRRLLDITGTDEQFDIEDDR